MTDAGITEAWAGLLERGEGLASRRITALFDADPERAERFSAEAAGLYLDYSKNRIAPEDREALLAFAEQRGVPRAIEAMFAGEAINTSEGRAVLHTALRDRSGRSVMVDGEDACALARAECDRMLAFVDRVHAGEQVGARGDALTTVVNIGIGGSDLGPLMVTEALKPYAIAGRRAFFVSNVDGQHLADVLDEIDVTRTVNESKVRKDSKGIEVVCGMKIKLL